MGWQEENYQMSKRKHRESRDPAEAGPSAASGKVSTLFTPAEELPPPDPPQPNLPFLVVTIALYAGWIGFLVWMALQT